MTNSSPAINGKSFLKFISDSGIRCATITNGRLPDLGVKAPQCYESLGDVLALMDGVASCYWRCAEGDHIMEFLIGRAANSAYAGLTLAFSGYYDQAISLARTLGEIANLLALFNADRSRIDLWKRADEKKRRTSFSPVKVRMAIEELKSVLPIDASRYSRLSEYSIHAIPNAVPQVYNQHGTAATFPRYQEEGFLLSLNEIALPIAFIAVFCSKLIDLPQEVTTSMQEKGRLLVKSLGSVQVTVDGRPWYNLQ